MTWLSTTFAHLSSEFTKKQFWTQVCQNDIKFVNKIRTQFDRCVISDIMLKAMLKSLPFFDTSYYRKEAEEEEHCHYDIFALFDILSRSGLKSLLHVIWYIHKNY